jgi:hypothetical protein
VSSGVTRATPALISCNECEASDTKLGFAAELVNIDNRITDILFDYLDCEILTKKTTNNFHREQAKNAYMYV